MLDTRIFATQSSQKMFGLNIFKDTKRSSHQLWILLGRSGSSPAHNIRDELLSNFS